MYRARDTRLERTVAVKILPSQFSSDPTHKQRFEREAKTISHLNHPHICVLHDIGHQDGIDYLVMEYVEGETLAKRLEKGALPLEQVLKLGSQIADGLDKAHRSGIVHRDLKPGNIMLTPSGAKLLDFGLAKLVAPLASLATLTGAKNQSPVTEQGNIVGTFQYMSPEQIEGKELDGRSDIFSLGAVLYEMVTGKRAFEGKSQLSVASAILEKEPPPILSIRPLTPVTLERIVKTSLRKDPEERFQSAHDLKLQLQWLAEGSDESSAASRRPTRRSWVPWILTGLALLLAIAAATVATRNSRELQQKSGALRASLLAPEKTFYFGAASNLALSPDGTKLAFVARGETGAHLLYVRPINSLVSQPLTGTDNAIYPFWSTDSRSLGFFADQKLKRIDAGGGPVQVLADAPNNRGGTWSRQGAILFAPNSDGAPYRVPGSGGPVVQVTKMDPAHTDEAHHFPEFSPMDVIFCIAFFQRAASSLAPWIARTTNC